MFKPLRSTVHGAAMCTLLAVAMPVIALAQTHDDARLTIGISGGWISAGQAWDVPNQTILSAFETPDVWHLSRQLRSDISLSGNASFFKNAHAGFTVDFTYLGLGTTDGCVQVVSGGDQDLTDACNVLKGQQESASTTVIQGGVILRPFAETALQPYAKAMAGFAFTPSSTLEMTSTYGFIGDTALLVTVYRDDSWKPIRPAGTLAIGIATAPSSGYQLRLEARETWLAISEITSAPSSQGQVPPHRSVIKGFPSILVGFDIVLERRHGRRY